MKGYYSTTIKEQTSMELYLAHSMHKPDSSSPFPIPLGNLLVVSIRHSPSERWRRTWHREAHNDGTGAIAPAELPSSGSSTAPPIKAAGVEIIIINILSMRCG